MELLVVVAITGILATIAYPSLMSQVRKSRRSDATAAMLQIQQAQERWRANNAIYTTSITGNWPASGLGLSASSPNGYYSLSVASVTALGYRINATAAPTRSQAGDTGCTTLVASVLRGAVTYTPASCWSN